uniref:Serine protease n=1 Tax=Amphiprion ocellaris TaxID=80972 RepID=A0A3Q1BPC4_AMPOC
MFFVFPVPSEKILHQLYSVLKFNWKQHQHDDYKRWTSSLIQYVKAVNNPTKGVSSRVTSCKEDPSSNLVMFHVLVKGGKNVVNILKNPALKTEIQEVTVYAYKGEKVKQALKRDAHFLSTIFRKNCALFERSTEINIEMSNPVDDLDGKTFQIIFLDDYAQLSSKFKDSMNGRKTQVPKLSRIQNLLRVEFEKNAETCREVKTEKKLMELSDSVCQVRINGTPIGSGFLLFANFVLTNAHVINNIYNDVSGQLNGRVTVNFSFYDLEQTVGGSVEVEEVVGYEYNPDVPPRDWALLKLSANENLPRPLAAHVGILPKSGAICIIGHPDGGVKKRDSCLIVATENRSQVVERHYVENQGNIQLITSQFFKNTAKYVEQIKQALMYETCFYGGSSGSPVFDKHCNVVAMHTGGYLYPSTRGDTSVIEFGYALSDIMEHMIIQMVEREKFNKQMIT